MIAARGVATRRAGRRRSPSAPGSCGPRSSRLRRRAAALRDRPGRAAARGSRPPTRGGTSRAGRRRRRRSLPGSGGAASSSPFSLSSAFGPASFPGPGGIGSSGVERAALPARGREERPLEVLARGRVRVDVLGQVLDRGAVAARRVGAVDPAVVPVVDQPLPAGRGGVRLRCRDARAERGGDENEQECQQASRSHNGAAGRSHRGHLPCGSLPEPRESRVICLLGICKPDGRRRTRC